MSINDLIHTNARHAYEQGVKAEQERILALKKEIINCVIDYGLVPEKYERICSDLETLIKGEQK